MNIFKRTLLTAGFIGIIATSCLVTNADAEPYMLPVPADPDGTYIVVQKAKNKDIAIIQMIRKGTFGTTYTSRLVDCKKSTFKYLATEDDPELYVEKHDKAMKSLFANDMEPLLHNSVSFHVAAEACK